ARRPDRARLCVRDGAGATALAPCAGGARLRAREAAVVALARRAEVDAARARGAVDARAARLRPRTAARRGIRRLVVPAPRPDADGQGDGDPRADGGRCYHERSAERLLPAVTPDYVHVCLVVGGTPPGPKE